ncbi:MAG: biopolymer transporter ExbD [Deltaproteobacteria bacterium]|nr:biopolymer transporter ExbD [Deltaproteobacteria bacterium]
MNVTPLVDIVLVLLIIFMVVAPRLEQDIPVELPGIFNPDPDMKGQFDPIKVTVAKKGEYYVEKDKYDLDKIVAYLMDQHAADPDRRLVLRADSNLTYGDVREMFFRCQQIGFPGMSLLVGEKAKQGGQMGAAPEAAAQGTGG